MSETEIVDFAKNQARRLSEDFSKTALRKFHYIISSSLKEKNPQKLKINMNRARVQLAYFIGRRGRRTEKELYNMLDPVLRTISYGGQNAYQLLTKVKLFIDALVAFSEFYRR